jgi:cell division septation protein DedD
MRMDSALRKQQRALAELIDIALHAVRESGETSVTAMHLQMRLQALADTLQPAAVREARAADQVASISKWRVS